MIRTSFMKELKRCYRTCKEISFFYITILLHNTTKLRNIQTVKVNLESAEGSFHRRHVSFMKSFRIKILYNQFK